MGFFYYVGKSCYSVLISAIQSNYVLINLLEKYLNCSSLHSSPFKTILPILYMSHMFTALEKHLRPLYFNYNNET